MEEEPMVATATRRRVLHSTVVVAAGHASKGTDVLRAFEEDGQEDCRTVLKPMDLEELRSYESLARCSGDPVLAVVPKFHGVVEVDSGGGTPPAKFLCLSNLLHGCTLPQVMDVKLGVRSFQESECSNVKPRPDLFARMEKQFPACLTDAEKQARGITKAKWLRTRDESSTTASLGYRIDGIAGAEGRQDGMVELHKVSKAEEACSLLLLFATCVARAARMYAAASKEEADDEVDLALCERHVAEAAVRTLAQLREAVEASPWARRRELIGTSVLLVADARGRCTAHWIDFAKAQLLPDGRELHHREGWVLGNRADGVLTGLDNFIQAWRDVVERLEQPTAFHGGA